MATNTTNYGFKKPDESDFYDVADQNKNWDLADETLKNLDTPTFEDYTGSTAVPSATDAIDQIKSKGKLGTLLSNIKAAFKGACLIGHIVNNCVTDNAGLPLSAAQGKVLKDLYTQLYSETERLNGYKVSYYGSFDKTLEELYDLSKMNTTCYIGFIDWKQSEITMEKGTIIWIACNWIVFGIANSGLYVLEGSPLAWKKI